MRHQTLEGEIVYESFSQAVKALWEVGRGSLLAKLDLKDAYWHIPIRRSDWNLLGFHWYDQFFYPIVLMFGGKSAPYIFNLFAEGLHCIIQWHIPATVQHYLDDFLSIFKNEIPQMTMNATI